MPFILVKIWIIKKMIILIKKSNFFSNFNQNQNFDLKNHYFDYCFSLLLSTSLFRYSATIIEYLFYSNLKHVLTLLLPSDISSLWYLSTLSCIQVNLFRSTRSLLFSSSTCSMPSVLSIESSMNFLFKFWILDLNLFTWHYFLFLFI